MRLTALAALAALLIALVLCSPSHGTNQGTYTVTEHPLPADVTGIDAMAIDGAGNVWLLQSDPPALYKFVRGNMTFSTYALKGFEKASFAGMSVDATGLVWFADLGGNRFGAYSEPDNHTALFDFPGPMAPTSVLRQGNTLWLGCEEEVGEMDLQSKDFRDHFVHKMYSYLYDIHFDRDGNVWFVENAVDKVGVYFHTYNKISEFLIPTNDSYPSCLAIDDRGRLWFVESAANQLGMLDTAQFNFSEYPMPLIDGLQPTILRVATVGDDVWLTDTKWGRVLKFYPDEGRFAAAGLGNGTLPTFIAADANGTLWVYEAGSKKLAALEVTAGFGQPTPTPAPTTTAQPTPSATPAPTKAPGFEPIVALAGLLLASRMKR